MADAAPPLLVVLTGPTGSGKSELALRAGRAARTDAAAGDHQRRFGAGLSRHGHRYGQTLGRAPRARVPHHLIDIRDPTESYSAGEFVRDARAAIAQIRSRAGACRCWWAAPCCTCGRCIGGWRRCRRPQSRCASSSMRRRGATVGRRCTRELERVDPVAAARIARSDAQRIQRALEVYRLTGVPISQWQRTTPGAREQFRWLRYALLPPMPTRAQLCASGWRRASRACCESGLVEEVRRLHARGDLTAQHASMRAVGYRQLWQVLRRGHEPRRGAAPGADRHRAAGQAPAHLAAARAGPDRAAGDIAVGLAEASGAQHSRGRRRMTAAGRGARIVS